MVFATLDGMASPNRFRINGEYNRKEKEREEAAADIQGIGPVKAFLMTKIFKCQVFKCQVSSVSFRATA